LDGKHRVNRSVQSVRSIDSPHSPFPLATRNLKPALDLRGYDGIRLRIKGDEHLQTIKVRIESRFDS